MSELKIEQNGRTTIFTLNRPDKANSINTPMARQLEEEFAKFDASDQMVAIVTGAGRNFCGGADLIDPPASLWRVIPTLGIRTNKPIICAVNGVCVGAALVFTAMADLCVAGESARFHYPEGRFALSGGLVAALATRIPHKFAMEIMLLCQAIPAKRAAEMGLINKIVPDEEILDAALEMARELEIMGPLVTTRLKQFVNDFTLPHSPAEQMARAMREVAVINESEDMQEGLAAFREKRPPQFKGR